MRFAVATCLLAACGIPAALAQTEPPVPPPPASVSLPAAQDRLPNVFLPRNYRQAYSVEQRDGQGSVSVPIDSWMYPALDRLHALGYLDTAFLGLRPWTRLSIFHLLEDSPVPLHDADEADSEAYDIYHAILKEVGDDQRFTGRHAELDTVYSRFLYIKNPVLNDSYHLGQTIYNDYGRPYQDGLNNVSGASGRVEAGRFTFNVRGEFQHSPSAIGYSPLLAAFLSQDLDNIIYNPALPQSTIPQGPIASISHLRLIEATLSYHYLKHEVSFGKNDHWLGPGQGGAFSWSNNADNIYAFEINRIEPMYVPLMRHVVGPLRYDFFVGSLQGHTQPNHPWVHSEKISIHPTKNLEMGFQRTVIWGGLGHEPVTIKSFLRSFASFSNVSLAKKDGPTDPGARFTGFDFTYRLPHARDLLTLYLDSFSHDDVNPISAPRRAAIRPGIYLSHFPGAPKLDFRVEGVSTDCVTSRCTGAKPFGTANPGDLGTFYFYEGIQQQGTTNKGFLFTDPVGRDAKGGQAWLTYNISPQEHLQLSYRNVKADKDFIPAVIPTDFVPGGSGGTFIPGGTTQNQLKLDLVKRISDDVEVHAAGQYEKVAAPLVLGFGRHQNASVWGALTWYPHKQKQF